MATREPITLQLDPEVVRLAREHAAASGRSEADVFQDALGAYVALETVERVRTRLGLSTEEADHVSYRELRAARAELEGPGVTAVGEPVFVRSMTREEAVAMRGAHAILEPPPGRMPID